MYIIILFEVTWVKTMNFEVYNDDIGCYNLKMVMQTLLEKRRVVKWTDGCVDKTEVVGEEWMPFGTETYKINDEGFFYCPVSSKRLKELNHNIVRSVKE